MFPSPFGEEVLESQREANRIATDMVSIPFRGRGFGKSGEIPTNQLVVSIPFRGRGFGKTRIFRWRWQMSTCFHPLSGKRFWKVWFCCWFCSPLGVSIPFRGRGFGKNNNVFGGLRDRRRTKDTENNNERSNGSFHPLSGKRFWKAVPRSWAKLSRPCRFHPLSGKRFWKEFAEEALHREGFRRRIDTPLKSLAYPLKKSGKHSPQTLVLQGIDTPQRKIWGFSDLLGCVDRLIERFSFIKFSRFDR